MPALAGPAVVVFDVNETLSDLTGLEERFAAFGAPPQLWRAWFHGVLRDGFAHTITGRNLGFADLARDQLRTMLPMLPAVSQEGVEQAAEDLLAAFLALDVHPDVVEGMRALHGQGRRLVTLSNGAAAVAESLLGRAGVDDTVERFLSVADAPLWKPARDAYLYGTAACRAEPGEVMLVAVHPWDLHGAAAAGLRTAWVNREAVAYPSHFTRPDVQATSLVDLADQLGAG